MKAIIVALLLLLGTGWAVAAPAPKFTAMSLDQIEAYFAGKTVLVHSRSGNDVFFFRNNGKLYGASSGFPKVAKSTWSVIIDDSLVALCLSEMKIRIPNSGGAKARSRFCVDARQFLRDANDVAAGDVLGLSRQGKVPMTFEHRKTTLAKLQAIFKR